MWSQEVWKAKRAAVLAMQKELSDIDTRQKYMDEDQLPRLRKDVDDATALVNAANLSEADIAAFSTIQRQLDDARQAVDAGKKNYQTAESEYQRLMGSIQNTIKAYEAQRKTVVARDLVASVAPHLKPTGIPQEILFHQMRMATNNISHLCAELGQPFKIEVDHSLEFIATWPNGHVEPVTRLSQGQRACAATMFWIARLLSNTSGLPIMILDEPSANMDADVVHQFGLMLVRLNQILVQRNLQVVLITHHQQLASCGSYVCRP
jgi:DNA repair exonuclease SbcCD ATPase subunit